jgi:hypothetical protein
MIGLIEGRAAGLAQARLLSPEAGGDGANIGDFAGAQAIDIGRAGPALLRRTLGAGGGRREQGEKESEDGGSLGLAGFGRKPTKSCLHHWFALAFATTQWRVV